MKTNTEAIQFLNSLVTRLQAGIIVYDIEGYITMINQKAIDFLGLDGEIQSLLDTMILDHMSFTSLHEEIAKCLSKSREDFRLTNVFHNERYFIIDGVKLLDGMLLSINDVTDTVLYKDKATQSLLLGIEIERRRLAKEIHDGVGPNMSTIKLQIDAVKRKLTDNKIIMALNKINESISEIASDIRQISHDLMPSSLIDFGLITALTNFTNRLNDTDNLSITFVTNIKDRSLSKEHELNIFRIIQELINNALKYSECGEININLSEIDDKIIIEVIDNGIGMDVDKSYEGIGLHNINTRVDSLQGSFTIDSQLGQGLTALVELPLKPNYK